MELSKVVVALANLIREKGQLLDPENDDDMTDRWLYANLDKNVRVVFHSFDELTNRIYIPEKNNLYRFDGLDMRENTFEAVRFAAGSEAELRKIYNDLLPEIEAHAKEMAAIDAAQDAQGHSIVDGSGAHKL